jgi:homeobox protein ESX1
MGTPKTGSSLQTYGQSQSDVDVQSPSSDMPASTALQAPPPIPPLLLEPPGEPVEPPVEPEVPAPLEVKPTPAPVLDELAPVPAVPPVPPETPAEVPPPPFALAPSMPPRRLPVLATPPPAIPPPATPVVSSSVGPAQVAQITTVRDATAARSDERRRERTS